MRPQDPSRENRRLYFAPDWASRGSTRCVKHQKWVPKVSKQAKNYFFAQGQSSDKPKSAGNQQKLVPNLVTAKWSHCRTSKIWNSRAWKEAATFPIMTQTIAIRTRARHWMTKCSPRANPLEFTFCSSGFAQGARFSKSIGPA